MKKLTAGMMLLAGLLMGNVLIAQSVEQGRKFLYYERFKSAKETFQKILSSDAGNEEAAALRACDEQHLL